jgi:hypothetical protein
MSLLMALFFLVFLGFFAISDSTLIITQKPSLSLSVARTNFATVSAGGLVFFAGGCTDAINCPRHVTNSVEIYNTNTDQWSSAVLSVARANLAAASAGDFVLFAGGEYCYSINFTQVCVALDAVDIYQISTNTWSVATLSQARTRIGATSANGLIFFAGGKTDPGNFFSSSSNVIDVFDTSSQTWSTKALSVARSDIAAAASGNNVLFAGGLVTTVGTRKFEIYNIPSQQWKMGNLPDPTLEPAAASVGRFIFITAGTNYFVNHNTDVFYVYDVDTNSLYTMYLLMPYYYLAIASTPTEGAVVFGGFTHAGFPLVEIYEVSTGDWYYIYNLTHRTRFKMVSSGNKIFFAEGQNHTTATIVNIIEVFEIQAINNNTSPQNPQSPNVPIPSSSSSPPNPITPSPSGPSPNPPNLNTPSIPHVPTILQNPLFPQVSKSSRLDILNSLLFCIICLFSLM